MLTNKKQKIATKEFIARLEAHSSRFGLNLKTGSEIPQPAKPVIPVYSTSANETGIHLPRFPGSSPAVPEIHLNRHVELEKAIEGHEIEIPDLGKAFLIECFPSDEMSGIADLGKRFHKKALSPSSILSRNLPGENNQNLKPEDVIILDIETTGLGNCQVFLIGTLECENQQLVCRQYLARNYAEESVIIQAFMNSLVLKKTLVSFNGKSFDVPFVRTRAAVCGVPFVCSMPHIDLLHESRRIWKNILPDCRLQTLEMHVCKRSRHGDIPGADIPLAYHSYVRTNNAVQLIDIITHNMLDMVTVAELLIKNPAPQSIQ